MQVLLFHKTIDADLHKGLQICYRDINGVFNKLGKITEIIPTFEGQFKYILNTSCGAYLADELKLIQHEPVKTWDDLKSAVNDRGGFIEVTEEFFYEALEVLPPVYLKNGCFQVSECYTADLYYTFGQRSGKYYGCLCNKNFALHNF